MLWLLVDIGNVGIILINCWVVFKVGLFEKVEGVSMLFGVNSFGVNEFVMFDVVKFGLFEISDVKVSFFVEG